MRGITVKHVRLGKFLKEAREKSEMSLQAASDVIGLSGPNHLWKCENGRVTFPAARLKRAAELYKFKLTTAVDLMIEDTNEAIRNYFRG